MTTLTLTRTRVSDGAVHVSECAKIRDARKYVAWCMNYNSGLSRREASAVADRLTIGAELEAHGYRFMVTR